MTEEWRPVPGWGSHYAISDLGRVRRLVGGQHTFAGRVLNPYRCGTGLMVHLTRTRRWREQESARLLVHRLVWAAFVGPLDRTVWVVPKNGDVYDARLANLATVPVGARRRHRERRAA